MASEDRAGVSGTDEQTARTVGQIVKYSREVNQSETVEQVGSYALEAAVHVLDSHPTPTVVELVGGEPRVVETMAAEVDPDGDGGPVVRAALEAGATVIMAGDGVELGYVDDAIDVREPTDSVTADVSIAVPSLQSTERGDVGVVLLVQWPVLERVESYHVKPVEYLADHLATAIANIRSRERLERARNDLARRKEMIEMYDRLLRHDLGNDLQIIAGFSDALVTMLDDEATDQVTEYADKIQNTAGQAADLIARVGELVKTLEEEDEPEARDLEPMLEAVVDEVDAKFDDLAIEFDADGDRRVYAGELLDSVFANIVSNAAVHNDGPVSVEISVEEPNPETIVVAFADDGAGVAPAVRDQLFEMGRKGPDSDGSGFGLGLVRALTESYGGSVSVGDSDAGGAEFRVALERAA